MPAQKEGPFALQVTPAEIEWRGVGAGLVLFRSLTIKNTDSRTHNVRVKAPRTGPLSVKGLDFVEKLAPGLSITLDVEFNAKGFTEDFAGSIQVQSESVGAFTVPVRVLKPRCDVQIIGNLNFGDVLADKPVTKTLQLVNHGEADAELNVVPAKLPIECNPSRIKVPRKGEAWVNVTFTGSKGVYDGELVLKQTDGTLYSTPFLGRCAPHQLQILDEAGELMKELQFGPAHYGQVLKKYITLRNTNAVAAEYTVNFGTAENMRTLADTADEVAKDVHTGFLKVRCRLHRRHCACSAFVCGAKLLYTAQCCNRLVQFPFFSLPGLLSLDNDASIVPCRAHLLSQKTRPFAPCSNQLHACTPPEWTIGFAKASA